MHVPFPSLAQALLVLATALSFPVAFAQELLTASTHITQRKQWVLPTGSTLAYTHFTAAAPGRPPVIYLHGGPGVPPRAGNFALMEKLAALGHDVYVYDQAGTGESPHLKDVSEYSLERHVADLAAIRQQLRADKLILFGVSWGAVLGAHYAAREGEHVVAAIFVSPGVLVGRDKLRYDYSKTGETDELIAPPARLIAAGLLAKISADAALAVLSQEEAGKILDEQLARPAMQLQGLCKNQTPPAGSEARTRGANYYGNLMVLQSLKRAPDPTERIARAKIPLLLLRGECDYIPAQAVRAYTRAFADARVIDVPGAGHAVLSTAPEQVLDAARSFLSELR